MSAALVSGGVRSGRADRDGLHEADSYLARLSEQTEHRGDRGFRKPEVVADLLGRDGAAGFQERENSCVEIVPPRLGRHVALIHRQEAARRCR